MHHLWIQLCFIVFADCSVKVLGASPAPSNENEFRAKVGPAPKFRLHNTLARALIGFDFIKSPQSIRKKIEFNKFR